ncbi:hypothetical protein JCM12141A_03670 [Mycolicibacterium hodleri]
MRRATAITMSGNDGTAAGTAAGVTSSAAVAVAAAALTVALTAGRSVGTSDPVTVSATFVVGVAFTWVAGAG